MVGVCMIVVCFDVSIIVLVFVLLYVYVLFVRCLFCFAGVICLVVFVVVRLTCVVACGFFLFCFVLRVWFWWLLY